MNVCGVEIFVGVVYDWWGVEGGEVYEGGVLFWGGLGFGVFCGVWEGFLWFEVFEGGEEGGLVVVWLIWVKCLVF